MTDLQFMCMQYRISMVFLLAYLLLFLPLRYKKLYSGLIAAGCFFVTGAMEGAIFFTDFGQQYMMAFSLTEIAVVQGTAYLLCYYRDFRALFTGMCASNYVLPGNMISSGLYVFRQSVSVSFLVEILVHLVLLASIVIILRHNYLREMEESSESWLVLCIVPALFYVVTYALTCWPNDIYKTKEVWLAIFLLLVLMNVTYMLVVKLIAQQRIDSELERSGEILETHTQGLRREAESLRAVEEEIRILRHDSHHMYRLINSYLEEGETEKAKELLQQMDIVFHMPSTKKLCENITINSCLSGYETRAKKENVKFICEADVPKNLGAVDELEFATVISNLLENALYAAMEVSGEEERKVAIRIFPVKGQLILEIVNTFTGKCEFSRVTGLPLSRKGEGHGYGLRSVQAYASKNKAIFRYSVENGMFCVRLLTDM